VKLWLVTSNPHKVEEAARILAPWQVESLVVGEVAETGLTFEQNARLKAEAGRGRAPRVIAEDSGLVVDGLGGAPGVYSARWAPTDAERIERVLRGLEGAVTRRARFVAVVCLVEGDEEPRCFEGVVEGAIADAPRGTSGFGYDPIFIPLEGDGRTFAELGPDVKDALSHRARALRALARWLQERESAGGETRTPTSFDTRT
jgi:XTP/dITP diphosphohydrolase